MIGLGKVSLIGLGAIAGIVSVMGVQLASAQSRSSAVAAATPVVTADTDITRLRQGRIRDDSLRPQFVINGPLVLTDLDMPSSGFATLYIVSAGASCSTVQTPILDTDRSAHGMKLSIPSGSAACLTTYSATWSGYVPY
ncbi:hypothetical protein LVJ94_28060 [Pendulispora rubella]|uniref:Uncharacterized protein n=1 Tax=Pendulispora rubella TaxID=2741070 RepID=A0ABZ2KQ59_9BACT